MGKTKIINEIIKLSAHDKSIDLPYYREYLQGKDLGTLRDIVERKRHYVSPSYLKSIEREIALLDRGGMFDIRRIAPENALD